MKELPMARLSLKLAGYPWDHLTPLLTGEVVPDGIDLQYDVHHGLGPVTDEACGLMMRLPRDTVCHAGRTQRGKICTAQAATH